MSSSRMLLLAALASAATLAACDSVRPLASDGSANAQCTSCHGYPPPPGAPGGTAASTHPNNTNCYVCHPGTVDASGNLIPASAGGLHQNGTIDVVGGHPSGFDGGAVHGPAAIADLASCQACHGSDYAGGSVGVSCTACHATKGFADWQTNCTFCHGTQTTGYTSASLLSAAPPQGVHGETAPTDIHVGAHQRHLAASSFVGAALPCGTCHVVPTDLSHLDGVAQVTFSGISASGTFSATAATCTVYCHGATLPSGSGGGGTNETPSWTQTGIGCTWCHSNNPTTGEHPAVNSSHAGFSCSLCHGTGYSSTSLTSVAKATHVNGTVEKAAFLNWQTSPQKGCTPSGCHSFKNW